MMSMLRSGKSIQMSLRDMSTCCSGVDSSVRVVSKTGPAVSRKVRCRIINDSGD